MNGGYHALESLGATCTGVENTDHDYRSWRTDRHQATTSSKCCVQKSQRSLPIREDLDSRTLSRTYSEVCIIICDTLLNQSAQETFLLYKF